MSLIKVEKKLYLYDEVTDEETEIECDVEVELVPAEKGYGECPDYDATQSVYSITCKGVNVTSKFSQEEQDALAEEIAKKGIEEGKEKKMEYALSMREAA